MPEGIDLQMTSSTTTGSPNIIKGSKAPPPLLDTFKSPASMPRAVKKAVLIYNPVSGGKKGQKLAETVVVPMFKAAGVEIILSPTTHAGHAIELAASIELSGVDALCALGGDGTLSDVASGFLSRSDAPDVALGFIPGGTGNTIMHDVLGYRPKMNGAAVRAAVQAILDGRTRSIDCSKFECAGREAGAMVHRHSLNIVTCGLGVDANAAAEKRRWMGPMRYDVSILLELLKIGKRKSAPCRLTVDGSTSELSLFVITIMNNKHSGVGLRLSPFAQMDDGKIDLMWTPRAIKSVTKALKLDGMIKKKGKHVNDPLVEYAQASSTVELTCDTEPQLVMVDGDVVSGLALSKGCDASSPNAIWSTPSDHPAPAPPTPFTRWASRLSRWRCSKVPSNSSRH